jgi:hypothetical protein
VSSRSAFVRKLVLAVLLAWSLKGFAYEAGTVVIDFSHREQQKSHPLLWRFGMPQVAVLERCAAGVSELVPAGSFVAFYVPDETSNAAFFRWRWAAYFHPEHHLMAMNDLSTARKAQFLVAFRSEFHHPRAKPMAWLPGCRLYRVAPR